MSVIFVVRQLGKLALVLSLSLAAVALWSLVAWMGAEDAAVKHSERSALLALLTTVAVGIVIGVATLFSTRKHAEDFLGRREALLLVALSWLLGAALGALPFFTWAQLEPAVYAEHPFKEFVPCYFEAMSGLTTTGSTVLGANPNDATMLEIENLPRGLLLWRATTHWLGGLGIVVLFVAVFPIVGVGARKMVGMEYSTQKVRPRIAEFARVLWIIYLSMTGAEILLLKFVGKMTWFDSVCHTFATLATGGFSTHSASVAYFDSAAVDWIITVFMFLAGINFLLYYYMARRSFKDVLRDTELRVYTLCVLICSLVVTWNLYGGKIITTAGSQIDMAGAMESIRYAVFQVVSIQTTTGFGTADFDQWDPFSKAVLMGLMFIGGSAGSTGGGIKVFRVIVAFKVMLAEVERIFRPNVVRTIRVGKEPISPDARLATLVYILGIFALFVVGTILIIFFESQFGGAGGVDFESAVTASAATLNNIGPGLAKVGATGNYGWFSHPSLMVMSVLMALGRLEVYAVFVLFLPRFWYGD